MVVLLLVHALYYCFGSFGHILAPSRIIRFRANRGTDRHRRAHKTEPRSRTVKKDKIEQTVNKWCSLQTLQCAVTSQSVLVPYRYYTELYTLRGYCCIIRPRLTHKQELGRRVLRLVRTRTVYGTLSLHSTKTTVAYTLLTVLTLSAHVSR